MSDNSPEKPTLTERLREEASSFAIIALYLFVCLGVIAYLKFSILETQGISFRPWAFAAIKALIIAKFMLVARAFERHRGLDTRPLIFPTVTKAVAVFLFVLALLVIEELVVGYFHGRSFSQSFAEMGGNTMHEKYASALIVLLVMLPLYAFRALGEVVGFNTLGRLYFERRRPSS
jgi:hypothetical protein